MSLLMVDLILGLLLGLLHYIKDYVSSKVESWVAELKLLASFAITQPRDAFSAFSHGLISRWLFVARTIPDVGHLFQPLKDCVRHSFITSVTGHSPPDDLEGEFLAFPARLGGLTLPVYFLLNSLLQIKLLSLYSHLFCLKQVFILMM